MGFWASFGALVLLAILLGVVITVINAVLDTIGLSGMIRKLPIIGLSWSLIVSILMMRVIGVDILDYWGLDLSANWDGWMGYIASGAIVYGMVPVKDAVVSMISKGFRM